MEPIQSSQDMLPPRSRYPTTGRLRRVLLRVAYSNAWIALHGAGYVLAALLLLNGKLVWMPLLAGFAGIQLVYTFAKVVLIEPEADGINDPERTAFILRWRTPLIGATAALWLAVVAVSASRSVWAALMLPMPLVVAMFYELKLLPKSFERRRLKDFTGVKSIVVGLTFGFFCAWLVPAWTDVPLNATSSVSLQQACAAPRRPGRRPSYEAARRARSRLRYSVARCTPSWWAT